MKKVFSSLLLSLVLCTFANAVPTIAVQNVRIIGDGATNPFFAEVNGQRYVFKSNCGQLNIPSLRMVSGNVEGEFLASRILQLAGIESPRVQLVKIKGRRGQFAMADFVGNSWHGDKVIKDWQIKCDLPRYPQGGSGEQVRNYYRDFARRFDIDQVRRLQVLDLLMGNGDRHCGNFFVRQSASGKYRLIAIDHNLAFVGNGQKPDAHRDASVGFKRNFIKSFNGEGIFEYYAARSGSVANIIEHNDVFQRCLKADPSVEGYRKAVADVKRAINDSVIEQLLKELPAEISQKRRAEIREVLRWRRDNMERAILDHLKKIKGGPSARARVLDYLRRNGMVPSCALEEFLLGKLIGKIDKGKIKIDLERGYYHLRVNGATRQQAVQIINDGLGLLNESDKIAQLEKIAKKVDASLEKGQSIKKSLQREVSFNLIEMLKAISHKVVTAPFRLTRGPSTRMQLQELDRRYHQLDNELRQLGREQGNHGERRKIIKEQLSVIDQIVSKSRKMGKTQWDSDLAKVLNERALKKVEYNEVKEQRLTELAIGVEKGTSRRQALKKAATGLTSTANTLLTIMLMNVAAQHYHSGKTNISEAINHTLNSPDVWAGIGAAGVVDKSMLPLQKRFFTTAGSRSYFLNTVTQLKSCAVAMVAFTIVSAYIQKASQGLDDDGHLSITDMFSGKGEKGGKFLMNLASIVISPQAHGRILSTVFREQILTCEFGFTVAGMLAGGKVGALAGAQIGMLGGPICAAVTGFVGGITGGVIGGLAGSVVGAKIDETITGMRYRAVLSAIKKQKGREFQNNFEKLTALRESLVKVKLGEYVRQLNVRANSDNPSSYDKELANLAEEIKDLYLDEIEILDSKLDASGDESSRESIVARENSVFAQLVQMGATISKLAASARNERQDTADAEEAPSFADLRIAGD